MGIECCKKQQETICWDCQNSTRCSWADGIPVKGWTATPTVVHDYDGDYDSYMVTKCPLFQKDTKRRVFVEEMAVMLGKTSGQIIYAVRSAGGREALQGWFEEIGYKLRINKIRNRDGREKHEYIIEKLPPSK